MSTPAHTPTLVYWSVDNEVWRGDKRILVIDSGLDEDSPNAAFIVRACNSHAALMAALGSLIGELDPSELDYDGRGAFYEARAVLAAAKE